MRYVWNEYDNWMYMIMEWIWGWKEEEWMNWYNTVIVFS